MVIKPVPPDSVVVGVPGQIVNRGIENGHPTRADQFKLPDPLGVTLLSLLTRVARLESHDDSHDEGSPRARVIRPPEAGVWHGEDFSI